jgi:hypothetical protein
MGGWTMEERRRHERYWIQAVVQVTPTNSALKGFWARADNVSHGGMFLRTAVRLPLYTELEAKITPEHLPTFRAKARVVRARDGEGIGCCFSHLTAQSRLYLEMWLGRSGGLPTVTGVIES